MSNTKTVREWLETLPEPYRTQAIENTRTLNGEAGEDIFNALDTEASSALHGAFVWSDSHQGFKYWNNLDNKLDKSDE